MAQQHPVIRRDDTIRSVLLGGFVVALAIAVVLSSRVLFYGSRSMVIPGADPGSALPRDYIKMVDDYGLHIPKFDRRPLLSIGEPAPVVPLDARDDATPLRLGYSIREGAAAGLPFRANTEHGHVIYYETPREFVVMPVTQDALRGAKVPIKLDDGAYSFWPYRWGWLFVIAAIGIGWFELGAQNRRREALDII